MVEVFSDESACVFVNVGAVLIESCFEFVFCFTDVLTVVALVTVQHVDDVRGFTCECLSDAEIFMSVHAFECVGLNEVVGANNTSTVTFVAAWRSGTRGGESARHDQGSDAPTVPLSKYRRLWSSFDHTVTCV